MSMGSLFSLLSIFREGFESLSILPDNIKEIEKRKLINKLELILEELKEL